MVLPREGHLNEVFHVFAYLKNHMNSELVFNPAVPDIDMKYFQKWDWMYSVYLTWVVELREEFPTNMTETLGLSFLMQMFVDTDHAGETVKSWSRSGYIVFLNSAPI